MEIKMKIKKAEYQPQMGTLSIRVDKGNQEAAEAVVNALVKGELELTCRTYEQGRSLSANAYCWVLCQKIAEAISTKDAVATKEDVYRRAIKRVGAFDVVTVRPSAAEAFRERWRSNGIGWQCDDLSDTGDGVEIAVYYGSSSYNVREMSRLLEDLVVDAKALGIQTETPEELARLLSLWEDGNER